MRSALTFVLNASAAVMGAAWLLGAAAWGHSHLAARPFGSSAELRRALGVWMDTGHREATLHGATVRPFDIELLETSRCPRRVVACTTHYQVVVRTFGDRDDPATCWFVDGVASYGAFVANRVVEGPAFLHETLPFERLDLTRAQYERAAEVLRSPPCVVDAGAEAARGAELGPRPHGPTGGSR